MSAFDRHPNRKAYEAMAERLSYWDTVAMRFLSRSPQNRRIRFLADSEAANAKQFPNAITRQQRRHAERQAFKRLPRSA